MKIIVVEVVEIKKRIDYGFTLLPSSVEGLKWKN
jgi:hypothetical protein